MLFVLEVPPSQNVGSWNALLAGCAQEGQADQALYCFEEMQCEAMYAKFGAVAKA